MHHFHWLQPLASMPHLLNQELGLILGLTLDLQVLMQSLILRRKIYLPRGGLFSLKHEATFLCFRSADSWVVVQGVQVENM